MEKTLKCVAKKHTRAKGNTHSFDSLHNGTDNVRRGLKAIWPDQIHQVKHGIFTSKTGNTKGQVLHDDTCRLTMDKITIGERILEHGDNRVNVVRRLRSDILEDERERLQTTRSNIEFGCSVFVQDSRDTCKGYNYRSQMSR